MKKSLAILAAVLALSACSTVSKITNDKGQTEEVTDFKAAADSNARIHEAQYDVMWNAQEAVKECYRIATTDIRVMACAMHAQSANMSQAVSGRPQPNRVPMSGTEANADAVKSGADLGKAAVTGAAAVGVAKAIKPAAPNVSNSNNTTTTTNTTTSTSGTAAVE